MNTHMMETYLAILREELIPAMGCTEPISLSYAAARLRETLGMEPERLKAQCSGNIIKNVRCVQIPNSGGMKGIEAAVALGAFGGNANGIMEVLEAVTEEQRQRARTFVSEGRCEVTLLESDAPLHFILEAQAGAHSALVEVCHEHTNVTRMVKDDIVIFRSDAAAPHSLSADRSVLNLDGIRAFADEAPLDALNALFEPAIRMNIDIACEGLSGDYGLGIGKVLMEVRADHVETRMKAYTAAASEARMDGCDMPVIINSGSGNQGIASTVPVIVYCREKLIGREKMVRALAFSDRKSVV